MGSHAVSGPAMVLCALEVIAKGAFAEVRLNDLPVATVGLPGGHGRAFVPLSAFVVRGANQLAARVAAMPDAEEVKVEIRVAVFQEGDTFFTNAGRQLARLDWAGPTGQAMLADSFDATFGPAAWAWSRCAPWPSPAAALADATPFVQDLARAYFANDTAWIEGASQAKFADMAIAFTNVTEDEMKAQATMILEAEPAEPLPPLEPPQPVLCGNNRLLLLLGPDGAPWLRKRTTPGATGLEVLLGKIDGRWQVVR